MTQARFSDAFGFSLDAVKHWETHRRQPEAAARVLLTVIENDPAAVIAALYPNVVARAARKSRSRTYARAKRYITRKTEQRSAKGSARAS